MKPNKQHGFYASPEGRMERNKYFVSQSLAKHRESARSACASVSGNISTWLKHCGKDIVMKTRRGFVKSILVGSFLMLFAIAGILFPNALHAQTGTITMISGNGLVNQQDAANKFTLDGGATWQDAYIIPTYSAYSLISGTKYLNRYPNNNGGTNTSVLYRTYFYLPSLFTSPTLTVKVFADNVATVFLNGVQFGQQPWAEVM